jgi:uncharacterized protein YegL
MVLINCVLILVLAFIVEAKYYSFWASNEGCVYDKGCKYKTNQAKIKGFAKGVSPLTKLWDNDFLICEEYYFTCGYLPLEAKDRVSQTSGVTVGIGVDLGGKTDAILRNYGISNSTIEKLSPYFGLKGDDALNKLITNPLILQNDEALELSDKVKLYFYNDLASQYDSDTKCETCETTFQNLNPGIRTALFSVFYNTGKIKYPDLWKSILKNDWLEVAKNIEGFKANKKRRQLEGLLIRSAINKCNKFSYTSFLLDESGSIASDDFIKGKQFIKNFLNKTDFKDNNVSILTFDSSVKILSDFTNNAEILVNALDSHAQTQGSTATDQGIRTANLLFNHLENNGTLKVLIVITDGGSDSPSLTLERADLARKSGINILSMGIGSNINQNELVGISGGNENVFNIQDYTSISTWLDSLKSSICNQNTPAQNNNTFSTQSKDFDSPLYYELQKSKSKNEKIILIPKSGDENHKVNIFASYSNPFPSEINNDLFHMGANQGSKEMVVQGNVTVQDDNFLRLLTVKREEDNFSHNNFFTADDDQETLYLSIYGQNITFDLKLEECDPLICKPGTNDIEPSHLGLTILIIFFILALVATGLGALYYFKYYKKRRENSNNQTSPEFEIIQ